MVEGGVWVLFLFFLFQVVVAVARIYGDSAAALEVEGGDSFGSTRWL